MAGAMTGGVSDSTRDRTFAAVLACFVLSGFAALLYETAWLRQFSIVFGTSELAVATVLATYMAGLALGAAVAGRFLSRIRRPILVYGLLELGVAVGALLVPLGLALARRLHVALLGGRPEPPAGGDLAYLTFYLLAAFVVVVVPTGCMGATLPMLTRHAIRRREQIGRRVGLLYAINTAGAVLGTLVAAFLLLPWIGLRGSVLVGVAVNALVFVIAALIARGAASVSPTGGPAEPRETAGEGRWSWFLPVMLLSGLAAFAYEVLWTRLLGHILGGSIYAFAIMLASFLTGITLGSAVASRLARSRDRASTGFVVAQVGAAVLSMGVYYSLDRLPGLARAMHTGEQAWLLGNAGIAALVLLPATVCLGATFPFAVRALARDETRAGPAAARVYAWNTVGAIAGAVLAGFLLLPRLGFGGTAKLAVSLNLVLAVAACLLRTRPAFKSMLAVAAGAVVLAIAFRPQPPEGVLRVSPHPDVQAGGRLVYSGVGRSATVVLLDRDGSFHLRSNGLPEARIVRRGSPPATGRMQRWLSVLPALARPEARSMLIVGFGGGIAAENVPPTIRAVDVIELEPEVIEANRVVASERLTDPLQDARVRIVINDARSALALTTKRYDAIVSQPSHPWTAGASHLYTREFFSLIREHLEDEGVFVQWMGASIIDAQLLETVGATLLEQFEYVRLYRPQPLVLLFMASDAPLDPEGQPTTAELLQSAAGYFGWLGLNGVDDVASRLALEHDGLVELCRGAPINTDDRNYLATRSPWSLRSPLGGSGVDELLSALDPIVNPDSGLHRDGAPTLDRVHITHALAVMGLTRRAWRVADGIQDPSRRWLALGRVAAVEQKPGEAATAFGRALELDPDNLAARFALIEPSLSDLVAGRAAPEIVAAASRLRDPAAAVVEAWGHAVRNDWQGVAGLEPRLARAGPTDASYALASQLRAGWRSRAAGASPELGPQALQIIDRSIATHPVPRSLLIRANAAVAADRPDALLETASTVAQLIESRWERLGPDQRRSMEGIAGQMLRMISGLRDSQRVPAPRLEEVEQKLVSIEAGELGEASG